MFGCGSNSLLVLGMLGQESGAFLKGCPSAWYLLPRCIYLGGTALSPTEKITWKSKKKHNFSPFSEKYLGSRVFVQKHNFQEKKGFINMPSCTNYIISNWCKKRSTLWATMHGRPNTSGTSDDESLDSAAKAMMSSGSRQDRLRLGGPVTTLGCKCAGACMANFPPSCAVYLKTTDKDQYAKQRNKTTTAFHSISTVRLKLGTTYLVHRCMNVLHVHVVHL